MDGSAVGFVPTMNLNPVIRTADDAEKAEDE
jgi:hypothetical protein